MKSWNSAHIWKDKGWSILYALAHSILRKLKKADFEDNKDITSKEWFASVEGEKVKCIQHWLGDQDFWFCHWIAESENQIHEKLEAIGADKLFLTMTQEMSVYATSDEPDKKLYSQQWRQQEKSNVENVSSFQNYVASFLASIQFKSLWQR